jgi:hypothetical protein
MYMSKDRLTGRKKFSLTGKGKFSMLKRIMLLDGLLLVIVPGLVVASVVIGVIYPIGVGSAQAPFKLQQGPGYATASALGFSNAKVDSSNNVVSGTTIYLNSTAHSYAVYLLNVLDIVNATTRPLPAGVVASVYINGSLPAGVTMYYSTSQSTFNGVAISGTVWTTGTQIMLPGLGHGHVEVYFSFVVLGGSSGGSGTLNLQYNL